MLAEIVILKECIDPDKLELKKDTTLNTICLTSVSQKVNIK